MGRWEPNARGRLQQAAIELFVEHGFEQTTVTEIAARAGLTERTFYRHYADKREVLFWGWGALREIIVSAVTGAPGSATAIDAAISGVEAGGATISGLEADGTAHQERHERARLRSTVIGANPELQERELIKMASIAADITAALRDRGVRDPAAPLAAEAAVAVFRIAFERWVTDPGPGQPDLPLLIRESLADLKAVTAS